MKRNHGLVRSEVYTVDKLGEEAGVTGVSAIVSDTVDHAFYANEGTWAVGFEITGFTIFLQEQYAASWATQDVTLGDQDTMTGGSPIRYAGDIYQNAKQLLRVYYKGSMSDPAATVGPTIYYKFGLGSVTLGELNNHTQLTGSLQGQHNKTAGLIADDTNTVGFFDIQLDLRFTGRTSDTSFYLDFYSSNDFSTPADRIQGITLRIKGIEFEVAIEGTSSILDGTSPPSEFIAQDQQQYSLGEGFSYRHKFRIKNAKNKGLTGSDIPIAWFEDPSVTGVTRTANLLNQSTADVQHSGTTGGWPTVGVNFTTNDNQPNTGYNPSAFYTDSNGNYRPMSEKWIVATYWPDRTTEGTEYFAPIIKAYYQDPDETAPSWHTIQWNSFAIQDYSTSAMGLQSTVTPTSVSEGSSVTYYYNFYDDDQMDVLGYANIATGTASQADFVTPVNTWIELNPNRIYSSGLGRWLRQYSFTIETASDNLTSESNETFSVSFALKRADGSYNIITSATNRQIINVAPDPTVELVGVPLNVYYNNTSADYTGAYDRHDIPLPSSGLNTNKRLFLGIKVGTSTTFYNDVCIAGISVHNSAGSLLTYYTFNGTTTSWTTTSSTFNYTVSTKPPLSTVLNATTQTISTSSSVTTLSLASATGSRSTGMADGISNSTTHYTQSSNLVSQATGTYYLYRETSGSTRYSFAFARSPLVYLPNGGFIRVIAKFATQTSMNGTFDPNEILYVGVA